LSQNEKYDLPAYCNIKYTFISKWIGNVQYLYTCRYETAELKPVLKSHYTSYECVVTVI